MAAEIRAQDVIVLIIYLVLLVLGAYLLTRYVAKRTMKKGVKKPNGNQSGKKSRWQQGRYVSVLDRIPIDRDKSIVVVEFAGKHYLMATTGQDIKLLDKLKKEETGETESAAETESAGKDGSPAAPSAAFAEERTEGLFFERFFESLKVVFKNYFKKKDTALFGTHLQNEMQKEKESGKSDLNGQAGR